MTSPSPTTYMPTALVELGVTRDGLSQVRREWPVANPKAIIVLVHGLNEHSGRYEHMAQHLNNAGFGVVSFDHRGHGQSGGKRSWLAHFDDFLDDVQDHLEVASQVGIPVVLCGHSMGALASIRYAVSDRPQPDLLVLSGPPILGLSDQASIEKAPGLLAPLAGSVSIPSPLPTEVLSHDQAVCDAYDADLLVNKSTTFDLLNAMQQAQGVVRADIGNIGVPTLAMAGSDDELVPPKSTRFLEGRKDIDVVIHEGLRHEIYNELNWQEIVDQVATWIDAHLPQS